MRNYIKKETFFVCAVGNIGQNNISFSIEHRIMLETRDIAYLNISISRNTELSIEYRVSMTKNIVIDIVIVITNVIDRIKSIVVCIATRNNIVII